jgi:hypothetical protein
MHVSFSVDLASSLDLKARVDKTATFQNGNGYQWQNNQNVAKLYLLLKKGLAQFGEEWSPLQTKGWNQEMTDLFILLDFKTIRVTNTDSRYRNEGEHEPDL